MATKIEKILSCICVVVILMSVVPVSVFAVNSGTTNVSGKYNSSWGSKSNLASDTIYTVSVGTNAKDLAGNNLQSHYSRQFTTISSEPTMDIQAEIRNIWSSDTISPIALFGQNANLGQVVQADLDADSFTDSLPNYDDRCLGDKNYDKSVISRFREGDDKVRIVLDITGGTGFKPGSEGYIKIVNPEYKITKIYDGIDYIGVLPPTMQNGVPFICTDYSGFGVVTDMEEGSVSWQGRGACPACGCRENYFRMEFLVEKASNPADALKFKGTVTNILTFISATVYTIRIDEVISDPADKMKEGDTAKVSFSSGSSAQVDSVEVGDKVEVCGTYAGYESGEHTIALEGSASSLVKSGRFLEPIKIGESFHSGMAVYSNSIYIVWGDEEGKLLFRKSDDGGITWSTPISIDPKGGPFATIAADSKGIYVTYHGHPYDDYGIYFTKSTDGGNSWTTSIKIGQNSNGYVISAQELPFVKVDSGNIYVYYNVYEGHQDNIPDTCFKKSEDGGLMWTTTILDKGGFGGIEIVNNVIYMLFQDQPSGDVWFRKSINGGVTWSSLVMIDSRCMHGDLAIHSDEIFVSYMKYDYDDETFHTWLRKSSDGGVTWSTPLKIRDLEAWDWAEDIDVFSGKIYFIYEIKNELWFSESVDDGNTWENTIKIDSNVSWGVIKADSNGIYINYNKHTEKPTVTNTIWFTRASIDNGDDTKTDLTITDIWWDLENPKIGDEVTFSYTVKNQGAVDTIAEFNNVLYIDGERYDQSARISLSAGEARDNYFPHRWVATAGDHTIKVIADGYGDIDERDETNNASIKTLEIVNLVGRVISNSTDDGIYDVTVTITPGGMTATTPPNGYYSFKDIPEGEYTITASKHGYTFNSVTVSVSKDTTTTAPIIIGSINRSIIDVAIVQEPKREDLDGTYIIGSRVSVSYTIKNTGEIEHTFYAGFSVRDKSNKYWDAPYMAVTLGKGDTIEVTLSWIVQEGVTVDHPHDVIIAVWATEQNTYLYDNLARREYENAFKIISGGTHVSGWHLYMEDPREVTVGGNVYTAIPATSHGSRSWLILNKNGKVVQDLETYKRAAEAASISESITPRTVSTLRGIKSNYHDFFDASFFGVRTILWIRDTGSWLLGKFIVIAATGGSSIGKDLPTGDVLKVATHEIAEQYKTKLIGDLTNLPRTKLTEKTIKKILWEATVQNIRISADQLDDAINVIENHNEGEPWSYQEAHTYYTNYKEAVLIGMCSMNFTMELQPESDLSHQLTAIGIGVLEGATSIKFDKYLALDVYNVFKEYKALEQSAIVYLKYKEMFDEMESEFNTTAEQIQKDALKTPSISGIGTCPVNIHAYDSQGRHVGQNPSGGNDLEIPGAYYSGPDSEPEGIVIFGQSEDISFEIEALDVGEFDFTVTQSTETKTTTVTYLDVQISGTTEATVDVSQENPTYIMEIDKYGDGTTIETKEPDSIETDGQNSYSLQLHTGWNLISIPLVPENTNIDSVFSAIAGKYSVVWTTTSTGGWKSSNQAFGKLTDITEDKGYLIYMTAPGTLVIEGTEPTSTTIDLVSGWNLVGYPSQTTRSITDVMSGVSYNVVWTTTSTGGWKSSNQAFGKLTDMSSGNGYMVYAPVSGSYTVS